LLANRASRLTRRTRLGLNHFVKEVSQIFVMVTIFMESEGVGQTMSQVGRFPDGQFQPHS